VGRSGVKRKKLFGRAREMSRGQRLAAGGESSVFAASAQGTDASWT
jgi:hypothetical protein